MFVILCLRSKARKLPRKCGSCCNWSVNTIHLLWIFFCLLLFLIVSVSLRIHPFIYSHGMYFVALSIKNVAYQFEILTVSVYFCSTCMQNVVCCKYVDSISLFIRLLPCVISIIIRANLTWDSYLLMCKWLGNMVEASERLSSCITPPYQLTLKFNVFTQNCNLFRLVRKTISSWCCWLSIWRMSSCANTVFHLEIIRLRLSSSSIAHSQFPGIVFNIVHKANLSPSSSFKLHCNKTAYSCGC